MKNIIVYYYENGCYYSSSTFKTLTKLIKDYPNLKEYIEFIPVNRYILEEDKQKIFKKYKTNHKTFPFIIYQNNETSYVIGGNDKISEIVNIFYTVSDKNEIFKKFEDLSRKNKGHGKIYAFLKIKTLEQKNNII
jgi:hypothetical protein